MVFVLAMCVWAVIALAQETKPAETTPAQTTPAAQPTSDDLALALANAQKANQAAITKWSWKVKANLNMEGESKATNVVEMRFNTEGKLDATLVSSESNMEQKRGIRGKAQANQIEDFEKYLEGVLKHSFQYIFMSKGTLVDVFDGAKITQGAENIDVAAADVFVKGDQLSMAMNPKDNLPYKLSFKTTLGEDTITGSVTMAAIENGPSKPTKFEIDVPTQAIKISSETYDWIEQK
jgi:hypothetical protein